MNQLSLNLYTTLMTRLQRPEKGQTSVEWMTIAAIFIVVVAAVFILFGRELRDTANGVIDRVFGGIND